MGEVSPNSLHAQLGGDAGVRAIVDAFYDRMVADPNCAVLRAQHPDDLSGSRDKLFWFLCGWLGGPQYFAQRFGHPRLRARHMPFTVNTAMRDQWLRCMEYALSACGVDAAVKAQFWQPLAELADWMRNQPEG